MNDDHLLGDRSDERSKNGMPLVHMVCSIHQSACGRFERLRDGGAVKSFDGMLARHFYQPRPQHATSYGNVTVFHHLASPRLISGCAPFVPPG